MKAHDVDKTRRTERPGFLHNHHSELVEGEIIESEFCELGLRRQSPLVTRLL